ncbi:hypothetical protein [Sorangium cellulosum]|uniref:hypothetical protein n=1 Tax=Sorangium cellulosum TaxID=56 RepID=UPI0013319622|nr:hypothetical protein [Sorangium cellulosum]
MSTALKQFDADPFAALSIHRFARVRRRTHPRGGARLDAGLPASGRTSAAEPDK